MKRIALYVFLIMFLVTGYAMAAGQGHHPNWKRYGYLHIPLTSFTTLNGAFLNETTSEANVSKDEAIIGLRNGKPAIRLGRTEDFIQASFRLPNDYWRGGQIEALMENTGAIGKTLRWTMRYSDGASLTTSESRETSITTASPAAGSIEVITFAPSGAEASFKEDTRAWFSVRKHDGGDETQDRTLGGTISFFDFVFKYEKKTDS